MAAKALLELDLEIARLREECLAGNATDRLVGKLKELLAKREELIPQMLAEREHAFAA